MAQLDGAYALVTGATAGIGLAIARRFVAEGAHVVVTGRDPATLQSALDELGPAAIGVSGDVSRLADLDRVMDAVREAGWTLDVLVANAGGGSEEPLETMTPESYDRVADLTMRGAFFTVRKALPLLADGARIVLVSSISGSNGDPGHSVYNASKAAVRSFARTMTNELRDRRIRVNALSPGPTLSRGFTDYVGGPAAVGPIAAMVPVGRVADPAEIAACALFLASAESSFVAGAELVADGGLSQV
jgi:NAD(P)-dependent dehydrogenase (short-subunit alcohol dehydrogenase family)